MDAFFNGEYWIRERCETSWYWHWDLGSYFRSWGNHSRCLYEVHVHVGHISWWVFPSVWRTPLLVRCDDMVFSNFRGTRHLAPRSAHVCWLCWVSRAVWLLLVLIRVIRCHGRRWVVDPTFTFEETHSWLGRAPLAQLHWDPREPHFNSTHNCFLFLSTLFALGALLSYKSSVTGRLVYILGLMGVSLILSCGSFGQQFWICRLGDAYLYLLWMIARASNSWGLGCHCWTWPGLQ